MLALGAAGAFACVQAHAADLPSLLTPGPSGGVTPFILNTDALSRERAVKCLAAAIYYEAADQPLAGREAVAQVVLNRLRHPAYPKSVCGVVYQGAAQAGCQFTFACDGSLSRPPKPRGWLAAREVAVAALDGFVEPDVGSSTHYHATYVRPAWSRWLTPTSRIGAHQFYRLPGARGEAGALVGAYSGQEPPVALASLAASRVASAETTATAHPPPPAPRAAEFSIWGLGVGVARPERDGSVSVTPVAGS